MMLIVTPNKGMKIKPAESDPTIVPNVFAAYIFPTALPFTDVRSRIILFTIGNIAPMIIVGRIAIKNTVRKICSIPELSELRKIGSSIPDE